jgi:hypothetical protein
MWTSSLGAALLLAACYEPAPQPGAPCTGDDGCPSGQRCVGERCLEEDGVPYGAIGCESTDTCVAAATLGAISGDTPSPAVTATGHTAAWFRVRVTENNDDAAGRTLRVEARLAVPAAADFDIFIYANVTADAVECATSVATASTTGTVKLVRASWGEGAIANGVNDGRDVSIEIRPIAGTCTAEQPWMLTVAGNWN